ncbi:patatin-like phospholipase family protein [Haloarchaeobius sp. DYHT-AS-18]|uniref:patatin-like phospholipase family protein n=1 Tax=Haloarchaeobius sp. DYHT-AS-18 TaxID=3446117 RepID=UPI003EC0EFC7
MTTTIAVACQGGGSHTAFTAGALKRIVEDCPAEYDLVAVSGTSGGGICALVAWAGLAADQPVTAVSNLTAFWRDIAAESYAEAVANDWSLASQRLMSEFGSVGISPYYNPTADVGQRRLRETILGHCDVSGAFEADDAPALFLGAVDVEGGDFTVFTTDEARVTAKPETFRLVETAEQAADAALASAAVPTIFEAVEIDGRYYWDGLFSQNPPIRHFTSGVDVSAKPDEIWIVRVDPKAMDPDTRDVPPRSMLDITDRRTELSGNLSLEQEKHTIETVNGLLDGNPDYKEIQLREVVLRKNLDAYSKLDRDPEFLADLQARGYDRADEFWTA